MLYGILFRACICARQSDSPLLVICMRTYEHTSESYLIWCDQIGSIFYCTLHISRFTSFWLIVSMPEVINLELLKPADSYYNIVLGCVISIVQLTSYSLIYVIVIEKYIWLTGLDIIIQMGMTVK